MTKHETYFQNVLRNRVCSPFLLCMRCGCRPFGRKRRCWNWWKILIHALTRKIKLRRMLKLIDKLTLIHRIWSNVFRSPPPPTSDGVPSFSHSSSSNTCFLNCVYITETKKIIIKSPAQCCLRYWLRLVSISSSLEQCTNAHTTEKYDRCKCRSNFNSVSSIGCQLVSVKIEHISCSP